MSTTRKFCQQLSSKSSFFLNHYSKHPESQGWTYRKVADSHSTPEDIFAKQCNKCKDFILTEKTDFGLWWRRISDIVNEARTLQDSQVGDFLEADLYNLVLQYMIGTQERIVQH